jgi:hypothetical protein
MKLIPTLLAALAYTGAQRLIRLAHQMDPHLPARIYVTGDLWCHLPEKRSLVLSRCSVPETVITITRYTGFTVARVEDADETYALVLFNHRETPYAMYGRDPEGFPLDTEDYDIPRPRVTTPEPPPADMDALIRNAKASNTLN